MTDAINICFYAGESNGSGSGAVWTTIHRDDMDKAEDWLRREKAGDFRGHPIHSQTIRLTADDIRRMVDEGIRATSFVQHQGEAVVVPVGVAHQVRAPLACPTFTCG